MSESISPLKSLSQNFLKDKALIARFIALANLSPKDQVLEIGPGLGALSKEILKITPNLKGIELDKRCVSFLNQTLPKLDVEEGDALRYPYESLALGTKVISNLPFHLTAPLLTHLVRFPKQITEIHVIIQKEVAERILAKPGSKLFGTLTLFLTYFSTVQEGFILPASSFYPKPKVECFALSLFPKEAKRLKNPDHFFSFLKVPFQQRRKMLRSTIGKIKGFESAMDKIGLKSTDRPEKLSLEEWITLYETLGVSED